jgi:hypothetical protein
MILIINSNMALLRHKYPTFTLVQSVCGLPSLHCHALYFDSIHKELQFEKLIIAHLLKKRPPPLNFWKTTF